MRNSETIMVHYSIAYIKNDGAEYELVQYIIRRDSWKNTLLT